MKTTIFKSADRNSYTTVKRSENDNRYLGYFIQTEICGNWNIKSYSLKKLVCTRRETRTQLYFIPALGADEKKIEAEIKRGKTFFSLKDGILFGAYHELTKLGEFVKIIS